MKITIHSVIPAGCLFLLLSCERPMTCDDDIEKGIIEQTVTFDNWTTYDLTDQTFIINSKEQLDAFFLEHLFTGDYVDPGYDFDQYTLLGAYTSGGGCEAAFYREVRADEEDEKYVYTIKMKTCGLCDMFISSMNWVLVPKLPNGWMVEFMTMKLD